jgi:predicted AAA+ superfamily ATPase
VSIFRLAVAPLSQLLSSPACRCLVVTGARQTGKTTMVRDQLAPDFEYHTFDEVLERRILAETPASQWLARGRSLVFDEVQKEPAFMGTVKAIADRAPADLRVVLTGSAQLALLGSVRETLAGRTVTRELYPLTLGELTQAKPLLLDLLASPSPEAAAGLLSEARLAPQRREATARARVHLEHLAAWGGMPALTSLERPEDRWLWLQEYCQTYLQRDLADLGRVSDLDDFVRLERLAARRTASLINYADLARDADLSPITTKKYLRYLELSYQAFLLPAFRGPAELRLSKSPKLHWMDLGIQRVLSGLRLGMTGPQFETLATGEILKLTKTLAIDVAASHLRTKDGREVDLLLSLPTGAHVAFEMKAGEQASRHDARHLRGLERLVDGPLLARVVLYGGRQVLDLGEGCHAVPLEALVG